jgi:hypothetical protein
MGGALGWAGFGGRIGLGGRKVPTSVSPTPVEWSCRSTKATGEIGEGLGMNGFGEIGGPLGAKR